MNRVILFGAYGFGNLGDDLLLSYYQALIREALPETERICLSAELVPVNAGEGFAVRPRSYAFRLLKEISPGDLWVGGGGSLLQNASSRRSLAYYLTLVSAARVKGARVVMLGQGFGPVRGGFWRAAAQKAVSKMDYVQARDGLSGLAFRRMGLVPSRTGMVVDPIWSFTDLTYIRPGEDILIILRREERRVTAELRRLLESNRSNPSIHWAVLRPDDEYPLRRALEAPVQCVRSREDLRSVLQGVGLVISSRFHGLILSALAGVPVVGFGDDPKIAAVCDQIGAPRITADHPDEVMVHSDPGKIKEARYIQAEKVRLLREQALNDRQRTVAVLKDLVNPR